MISVGIFGGTGYTGVELLRLLIGHPEVRIQAITSRTEAGKSVADLFPNLRGRLDLHFSDPSQMILNACDVIFFATPNGTAMEKVPALLEKGIRIIDLAADFRLKDPEVWEKWYGFPHACPTLLDKAVYGLPEINRAALRTAYLVANPGCYPTAVVLGLLPLIEQGLIAFDQVIADAKSGVSGAGRKATLGSLLCESTETLKAYAVSGHRHLPEICQILSERAGQSVDLTFVPHLMPMIRGIHATLYATLRDPSIDLQALYHTRYANEPFIDVLPPGSHPETRWVRGSNLCRLAIHRPQNNTRVVILSVIDNLVKGAAGQAVQNMNIMFGFPETLGLRDITLLP